MASITRQSNGNRLIQFVDGDKRRSLSLGSVTQKVADEVKRRIELIVAAKLTNTSIDSETAAWLAGLSDAMSEKLAAVDLIPSREPKAADKPATLGEFVAAYVKSRTDAKPGTLTIWRQGKQNLFLRFPPETLLKDITPGAADKYRIFLTTREASWGKKNEKGERRRIAPQQADKLMRFAKLIFRAAVRDRLIPESPFQDVKIKFADTDNDHFVTPEDTARLIKACSNYKWRAIIALARYGGLRCPSEVLSVKLQDVDWETNKITVYSPKTEHHPGKDKRVIPIFPELRPYILEAAEQAPDGAVYLVDDEMRSRADGPDGWVSVNLRTTMEKIVKRAGLPVWKRLFHNLRASRQTELEERFPTHVVCKWLGNSPRIARKHYLKVTDEHFARATAETPSPRYAESDARAMQNPVQSAAVAKSNNRKESLQVVSQHGVLPIVTESYSATLKQFVGDEGLEPVRFSAGKTHDSTGAMQNPMHFSQNAVPKALADAWPKLSKSVQRAILTLAKTAKK